MLKNNREIKDVVYLTALQGLNYVAPLIVFPYLMKVLGAEKFGYIGFSLAIIQYLMLLVDFGFNFSATKKIALAKGNQQEINQIFSSTLNSKIGLLLLSFIILLICAFAIPRFSIYSSTLLVLFFIVVGNTFSFVWLFQGMGQIRIVSIINTFSKLMILPLTFWLVKSGDDYLIAAVVQSSVYLVGSLITILVLIKRRYITRWITVTFDEIKKEISDAYPIFLSSTASSVYTALFAVILGYFSNPVEVGKYTAAEKLMRGFCFVILIPVTQAYYPRISVMSLTSKSSAVSVIKKILVFLIGAMTVVFFLMFFFSEKISFFLGKDYSGVDAIFKIMAFTPIFIASGGVLGQLGLLALGNERDKKKFQYVYFVAAFIAIISIFILVPNLSSIGASVALLITEISVFIGMWWFTRKLFKI